MSLTPPLNFKNWIDENRHLLKPPVGNKVVYSGTDFLIMVVGGPNSRKDYHVDPVEEFFYQIEGDMLLKIIENGQMLDIPIKEGEIFLLPAKIPHSPMRSEGSIGLVIECKRSVTERDGLMWFCDKCNEPLHDTYFQLTNVEKDFQPRFKEFYSSEEKRTCKKCGHKMKADKRFVE